MTETVSAVAFVALAIAALGGSLAMLASRNVVHAAYWLLEVSVAAAGLYWLLDAEYVALMQLLVYAGAVAILLIFTIMITLRRREDATRPADFSAGALVLAALFFGVIALAVRGFQEPAVQMPESVPDLAAFGSVMFAVDGWALPFEIASLVLTVALVGAVWWSKEGDD